MSSKGGNAGGPVGEGPGRSFGAGERESLVDQSDGLVQPQEGESSSRGASREHCVTVCVNVHCSLNGADELVEHLVAEYGVAPDVPSETGLSVELTYCFGACDLGPNVEIDGQFSDGVTIERLDELLSNLRLQDDKG